MIFWTFLPSLWIYIFCCVRPYSVYIKLLANFWLLGSKIGGFEPRPREARWKLERTENDPNGPLAHNTPYLLCQERVPPTNCCCGIEAAASFAAAAISLKIQQKFKTQVSSQDQQRIRLIENHRPPSPDSCHQNKDFRPASPDSQAALVNRMLISILILSEKIKCYFSHIFL